MHSTTHILWLGVESKPHQWDNYHQTKLLKTVPLSTSVDIPYSSKHLLQHILHITYARVINSRSKKVDINFPRSFKNHHGQFLRQMADTSCGGFKLSNLVPSSRIFMQENTNSCFGSFKNVPSISQDIYITNIDHSPIPYIFLWCELYLVLHHFCKIFREPQIINKWLIYGDETAFPKDFTSP